MPAPQAMMMKMLAKMKFASNALKVPAQWQQPQGDPKGQQYTDAFPVDQRMVPPDVAVPPLFMPQSMNKYHVDTQKMLNQKFGSWIDGICDAICNTWSMWQSTAMLMGVMINAVTASLGQVAGPPWTPLILAYGPMTSLTEMMFTSAVATVLGTAWLSYTATIMVPGLPWYPAFAAVPSPVAPPMPNIPMPLIALTQVTATLQPALLKSQMVGMVNPMAPYVNELFDAITDAFDKCFTLWQMTTMVTNVIGTGMVPTFAPPYVPVGPVVGGFGFMTPGGFV